MNKKETVLKKIKETGFRLTPQRLAIIEYLVGNREHPSMEKIYSDLKPQYPMLSLSTVYNTIKVLKTIGEIQELTISDDRVYIEPNLDPHHHFFCEKCGRIYDVWPEKQTGPSKIDGHLVHSIQVYYYGLCVSCQQDSSPASS
ncbi:MAG TPA: transcriptional repressor [Candidatus Aminicenantes bacterium]|nr:transcriptional repressor [Candidatus Aminicenantes bacterium]